MNKEIEEKISRAQMVLVGIGKEMEEDFRGMEQSPFYSRLLKDAEEQADPECMKQYLRFHYLKRCGNSGKKEAYRKLAELLQGKNYFIVSLCTDDLIFGTGLDESRIVTPCGGYRALQCMRTDEQDKPLCGTGREGLITDENVWGQVLSKIDEGTLSQVELPVCAQCGGPLAFNQIITPGYREEGYLSQWEKYKLWLQGTLNKELCVLELGVGMEYPMVIRFPFEKVAFFNQKASFFRVHSRLYQLTAELKERGISIKADPADFLCGEACGRTCVGKPEAEVRGEV